MMIEGGMHLFAASSNSVKFVSMAFLATCSAKVQGFGATSSSETNLIREGFEELLTSSSPVDDATLAKHNIELPKNRSDRKLSWWGSSTGKGGNYGDPYETSAFQADPSLDYDMFAQGWRLLGGFISCEAFADHGSGDRRRRGRRVGSGSGDGNDYCERWVVWAAYVNNDYNGGGAEEYCLNDYGEVDCDEYGNEESNYEYANEDQSGISRLDCYDENSSWEVIGVFRIDVDNFLEQIAKHLWALETYEYVTTYSALDYINGGKCRLTGEMDSSGNYIYAALAFVGSGGNFRMKLYSDEKCTEYATNPGFDYDDLGWTSDFDMGSGDDGYYGDDNLYSYWTNAQESSLTNLNGILDRMRGCILCPDYPSYQDGELNGEGYDEDDLINQCWKFWSHDALQCDGDCLALAHRQGSISSIPYAGQVYGAHSSFTSPSNIDETSNQKSGGASTVYLCFASVVLIATSLTYFVTRGDNKRRKKNRSKKSSKSTSLLNDDESYLSMDESRKKRTKKEKRKKRNELVRQGSLESNSKNHPKSRNNENYQLHEDNDECGLERDESREERKRSRRNRRKGRERQSRRPDEYD